MTNIVSKVKILEILIILKFIFIKISLANIYENESTIYYSVCYFKEKVMKFISKILADFLTLFSKLRAQIKNKLSSLQWRTRI